MLFTTRIFTAGGKVFDKLSIQMAVATRIKTSMNPEELGVMVNITYTPYRIDEAGRVQFLESASWTELHSDVTDGSDMLALQSFGAIQTALQAHINSKNF